MKFRILNILLLTGLLLSASSCFDDDKSDNTDYSEWKNLNEKYIAEAEVETNQDGTLVYTKLIPSFAPGTFYLIKWNNDRALTASALSPMDNSTIDIKYEVTDIDNNVIDNSYSIHTYGDGIYRTKPTDMIIGVHSALTNMHIGDDVDLIIPSSAAYGNYSNGSIKPFSTLKFNVKLIAIPGYEINKK
ncbi:MAG: FKBP-type peptidyl-prolyl cis-trans isomerase [Muribaculaceae bacterium]|nr:FKBP-type peptidyl-prolyl cis-trans isomerase [Muribaculaceae bacterium]